jgi:hypothetical protein
VTTHVHAVGRRFDIMLQEQSQASFGVQNAGLNAYAPNAVTTERKVLSHIVTGQGVWINNRIY